MNMTEDQKNAYLAEHSMPIVREIADLDTEIARLESTRRPGEKADRRAVQRAHQALARAHERLSAVLQSVVHN